MMHVDFSICANALQTQDQKVAGELHKRCGGKAFCNVEMRLFNCKCPCHEAVGNLENQTGAGP